MDEDCTVRHAVPGDAGAFAGSQVAAWRAAYGGILSPDHLAGLDADRLTPSWERRIADAGPDVRHLALCVGSDVVGWSGVGAPRDDVDAGTGEVHALNVSPGYWSRGFGSALFSRSMQELAAMGYLRGYLWVADGNTRAISFYARHGWHVDGVTKEDGRFTPALHELRVSAGALG